MWDAAWLKLVKTERVIAVIRASDMQLAKQMALAVAAGGMRLIEITWNTDRAADLLADLQTLLPNCVIGAGTLLRLEDMEAAIGAGAQFLFTPHTDRTLIERAVQAAVPIIPGAFSPTEIVTAWQAGASSVKIFPVQVLGGPAYIQNLKGPLGQIPLIPTGGVTLENTLDFLKAGAVGVGLSSALFPPQALTAGRWSAVTECAQILVSQIEQWQEVNNQSNHQSVDWKETGEQLGILGFWANDCN